METALCPKCEAAIPVDNLALHALRCSGKPAELPAAREPPPAEPPPQEPPGDVVQVRTSALPSGLPDLHHAVLRDGVVDVDEPSLWACPNCTFENAPADFVCDMCDTPRLGAHLATAAARRAASAPLLGRPQHGGELLGHLDSGEGESGGAGPTPQEAELSSALAFRRRSEGRGVYSSPCYRSPWVPCIFVLLFLVLTASALTLLALPGDNLGHPAGMVAFVIVAFAAGCTGAWGCVACRRFALRRRRHSMLGPDLRNLSPEAMLLLRQMMELEAAETEGLPAHPGAIAQLPTNAVSAEQLSAAPPEHRSCTICMEEYNQGDIQKTLPCFHRFHSGCIDQWLRQQGTCPICKHRADAGLSGSIGG